MEYKDLLVYIDKMIEERHACALHIIWWLLGEDTPVETKSQILDSFHFLFDEKKEYNPQWILSFFAGDIQEYGYLRTFGNLFYFSVVVFSTVGFGEITPLGLLNKTVMIFEGLAGGIIVTIFIIAIYRQLMDR